MRIRWWVLAPAALIVLGGGWFLGRKLEGGKPVLSFAPEPTAIGRSTALAFTAEDGGTGIRGIRVTVGQKGQQKDVLAEEVAGDARREVKVVIDPQALSLDQGPVTLTVAVRDRSWRGFGKGNLAVREFPLVVDTLPPRIDLLSTALNVNMGGVGVVAYRVSEEGRTGIEVGDRFFPAYPERAAGAGGRVAMFVLPQENAPTSVSLVAGDAAGNAVRRAVAVRVLKKEFRQDAIELSDAFLANKMPEFQAADPSLGADPLKSFLAVNREWRDRDHGRIRELATGGSPDRLWSGAFVPIRNGKVMAGFGDRRGYRYGGVEVDRQTHMGLDLASLAGAPVPAANAGLVAYTGDLGIYGQTVLLDHGQGLFTLYAHLSGTAVNKGDRVEKGQTVGTTGQTGMAGGDHLHWAVLVGGVFSNPLEWLDQHWITDNVEGKLALFGPPPAR